MKAHFNTTHEAGQLLMTFEEKAKGQEDTVYDFFKKHPFGLFTAIEVRNATGIECRDSAKRAVSNLKNKGLLVKTDQKVIGDFGKPNYKYKLA